MGLLDHIFNPPARRNRMGEVEYTGDVLTTTNGDLSATDVDTPLFSIAKVGSEAGRYRITIKDGKGQACTAKKLTSYSFGCTAAADAAYTTAKGSSLGHIRNNLIASAGTFEIQFVRSDTQADAEVEDGARIFVRFSVKKSSVT